MRHLILIIFFSKKRLMNYRNQKDDFLKYRYSETHNKICLTFDIDWVKDEILQPIVDKLISAKVKTTLFATHQSDLINNLDRDQFEIGIHPNFLNIPGDYETPVKELRSWYSEAKGVRSHHLYLNSRILASFKKYKFQYESNYHLFLHEGLRPFIRMKGLVSIPFYWQDDTHFRLGKNLKIEELHLNTRGLKVLAFHPMHVFMNTKNENHFESYKEHHQNPSKLKEHINHNSVGVGHLFNSLIDYINQNELPTYTLHEIYQEYINKVIQ